MIQKYCYLLFFLCASFVQSSAQVKDTISTVQKNKKTVLFRKSIIPVSLIGVGLLLNNSDLEKRWQTEIRNKVGNEYDFPIDDYVQYIPIIEMYAADAFGVQAKNHWFDQTKYLFMANAVTSIITHTLKRTTQKNRPNGAEYSFPSGHTSFAFTNASVLYKEFEGSSSLLAYSGYAFATTTGVFRVLNNKHWVSDVLVGAGLGMLVTELIYYFEPFKDYNPFMNTQNITLLPQFSENEYGVYFSYSF